MSAVTCLGPYNDAWVLVDSDGRAAKRFEPAHGGIAPRQRGGNGRFSHGRIYVERRLCPEEHRTSPIVLHGLVLARPDLFGLSWVLKQDYGSDRFGEDLLYHCKSCMQEWPADMMVPRRSGSTGALLSLPSDVCKRCHADKVSTGMHEHWKYR